MALGSTALIIARIFLHVSCPRSAVHIYTGNPPVYPPPLHPDQSLDRALD
jgi:hypothetical protein